MTKDINKFLKLSKIISIVILFMFFIVIIVFNDYIIVPDFEFLMHMKRGREYWDAYLNLDQNVKTGIYMEFIKKASDLTLIYMFLFILLEEKFRYFINKKRVIYLVLVMAILYFTQRYITYKEIYDYKIYMIFFPTIILAGGVLYLSSSILKQIKKERIK